MRFSEMNFLSRTSIHEGRRAGIPNQTAHEKTIVLYLDERAFWVVLGIPHEETIQMPLLDWQGNILRRTEGPIHKKKEQSSD